MNASRLAFTVTAVAAALLAVVTAIVAPNLLPTDALISLLGNDYLVVAAFGVVAFAAAVLVQANRQRTGVDQARMPDAEDVSSAPRLGAGLDAALSSRFGVRPTGTGEVDVERVRGELRSLAVAVEARDASCSRATARRRVDRGAWTTDSVAAAALRDPVGRIPRRDRARAVLTGYSPARFGLRRAALELDRRTGKGEAER